MIRTTPFHPRLSELNTQGLYTHWQGHLSALRYSHAPKHEYFAVRNSAGFFDTSPLYKYRITGPDAERFLADLRGRFTKFGLELHPGKTRLIEFGRFAAERRAERGFGKPDTFQFLGFTHICGKTRGGRFALRRITDAKRMQAKLHKVRDDLRRRMHLPIPD